MLRQDTETTVPVMTVMERAVIYARVSGDDRGREGRNLAGQLEMGQEYAQEKGYKIVAEFSEDDRGASGAEIDLPQLNKIREMAHAGRFDVLIVRELDRLSRNLAKQLIVEEELKRDGVRVEYVLAEYDDTPEGRLNKHIRATIAEYEREKISERMARGRRLKVRNGKLILGRNKPYGYRVENDSLIIDEFEAEIVRTIFHEYVSGTTLCKLCKMLDKLGVYSPQNGRRWYKTTISNMLSNETYIGKWHYGKTTQARENWITVNVPAIIDEATFSQAQVRKAQNSRYSKRNTKYKYLMRQRMHCHHCEGFIAGQTRKNTPKRYRVYYCYERSQGRKCHLPVFHVDAVDSAIWNWVKQLLMDEENLKKGLTNYQNKQAANPLESRLQIVNDLIRQRRQEFKDAVANLKAAKSPRAKAVFSEDVDRIEKLLDDLEAKQEEITLQLAQNTLTNEQIMDILKFAAKVREGLGVVEASFELKVKLIGLLRVTATLEERQGKKLIHVSAVLDDETLQITYNTSGCGILQ